MTKAELKEDLGLKGKYFSGDDKNIFKAAKDIGLNIEQLKIDMDQCMTHLTYINDNQKHIEEKGGEGEAIFS